MALGSAQPRPVAQHSRDRLREIQSLDPRADDQRIVHVVACYEFPWDMTRSLELALFRTFCDPRIGTLLARTGEFVERTQKRYDDTDILVSELLEWGYESERGRAALDRINAEHARFRVSNEDFLYVLSTFVFEPIRWNRRFGWRRMCDIERLALFWFWRTVGERMGIEDVPDDYDAYERFNRAHEDRTFRHTKAAESVGRATLAMFAGWFPAPARPLVRASMRTLMNDRMLEGFGLRTPTRLTRATILAALRARALALRVLPKRRRPRLRTLGKYRSYPDGYELDRVGASAG